MRRQIDGDVDNFRLEKRYLRKDGKVRWADVRSAPIRDADGRFQVAVTVISDITERKRAEAQLKESDTPRLLVNSPGARIKVEPNVGSVRTIRRSAAPRLGGAVWR